MKNEFYVTGLGLKPDGRMILPGSVLKLKGKPPAHWSRFGEYRTGPEPVFEVATPEPEEQEGEDLGALRALYQEQTGEEPDKRWKEKRLKEELGL